MPSKGSVFGAITHFWAINGGLSLAIFTANVRLVFCVMSRLGCSRTALISSILENGRCHRSPLFSDNVPIKRDYVDVAVNCMAIIYSANGRLISDFYGEHGSRFLANRDLAGLEPSISPNSLHLANCRLFGF